MKKPLLRSFTTGTRGVLFILYIFLLLYMLLVIYISYYLQVDLKK